MAELPSVEKFICVLQKCRKKKDLDYAKRVHAHICNNGLETHRIVGNYIVPMFVECGSLSHAQQVFNRLVYRNEYSWTSIILGHIQCGQSQHALDLYDKMREDSIQPSSFTLMTLLKACTLLKDEQKGQKVHVEIVQLGFENEPFVGCTLVSMYGKCGLLSEAMKVFAKLPVRDVVSWTALIGGYAEHGPCQEALSWFEQMHLDGVSPNDVTLVCILKACGSIGAIDKGRETHMEITQMEYEKYSSVGNTLVDMYVKCGSFSDAQDVFQKLSNPDVVSWNALISGYSEHEHGQEVLNCFQQMQLEGVSPDAVTFTCILKACGTVRAVEKGQEMHLEITQKGFERDGLVGRTLVSMYAKCGSLSEAWDVFDKLPVREAVSWTALIAGYAEHGPGQQALKCFEWMQLQGMFPDNVTFVCVLKACGRVRAIDKGRKIHMEITQEGFECDLLIANSLVDMYAKCGLLSEAQELFAKLSAQEVVSWTALIGGYAEHGSCQEALRCFEQMKLEEVSPNAVTFVTILKACGGVGAVQKGQEIHTEITEKGLETCAFLGSALVDMYAKFGFLLVTLEIFAKLPFQDVASWNALMTGYVLSHEVHMVLRCFDDMQEQGVEPNAVTFTCLLTACSHASLILKGQEYFTVMREQFRISPTIDHCTCMVDLLARSGHLCEAKSFLVTMSCIHSEETWRALLGGCKFFGETELGLRCFQQLVQLNSDDACSYMLMADIYANADRWDDVARIENLRKEVGASKKLAIAVIELNKQVHEFVVGDNQCEEISTMIDFQVSRMKEEGYVPNLDLI